jgi:hypothetical protein
MAAGAVVESPRSAARAAEWHWLSARRTVVVMDGPCRVESSRADDTGTPGHHRVGWGRRGVNVRGDFSSFPALSRGSDLAGVGARLERLHLLPARSNGGGWGCSARCSCSAGPRLCWCWCWEGEPLVSLDSLVEPGGRENLC